MPDLSPRWRLIWGDAAALLHRTRQFTWVDLLVLVFLAATVWGMVDLAKEWEAPHRVSSEINLSPLVLPEYTFYSLSRGLAAYAISLAFTLVYGYWAAKDELAAKVLIPLLDILQSLPVLAFLPGLLLALNAAFPRSNIGLEMAAILMIFTGQAWNMTFSFYYSLRGVPADQREAATVYHFTWWQRLKWVELPFSTMGLVWNSMMSMAGGWFFLMINEAYQLGDQDFFLPGLGSYMKVAVDKGRVDSMLWAMLAMLIMIVGLDQFLWRPVVVWAQKFRVEEGGQGEAMKSWFLNLLKRSGILALVRRWFDALRSKTAGPSRPTKARPAAPADKAASGTRWASTIAFGLLMAFLVIGAWKLGVLLAHVSLADWGQTLLVAMLTLLRVLSSTFLGTLWTVPAGLAIGLSPKLSRIFQPIVQVAASFPAPMIFPLAIALMQFSGIPLGWGSIVLMLLGTQWYILFNIIAGAMAIPSDLREASVSFRMTLWQKFRTLYLPAVFPYLVTGWVTAAGGAWNASIVAEYVTYNGDVVQTWGLGGQINHATANKDFALLAASVLVMAAIVVLFNRLVWRRMYELAEKRYSLSK